MNGTGQEFEGVELPRILTLDQVCHILRVGKVTAYRMIKRGELRAFKIGSDWRIRADVLEAFMLGGEQVLQEPQEQNNEAISRG